MLLPGCIVMGTVSVPHFLLYIKYCSEYRAPAHTWRSVNIGGAGAIADLLVGAYLFQLFISYTFM